MRPVMSALCLAVLVGTVQAQGTLHVPVFGPVLTLDPHVSTDPSLLRVFAQLYEAPLSMRLDSDERAVLWPAVCELPMISKDGKTVTLRLAGEARFHDDPCFEQGEGRAVAVRDLAYSILRHADPRTRSPWWVPYLEGRIVGLDAWRDAALRPGGVADYDAPPGGLQVKGEALVIGLHAPYPQFPALLSQPWASIVPREAVNRSGLAEHPVGSGPFRFVEVDDHQSLQLARHPNYRRAGLPLLEGVAFDVVPDLDLQQRRFLQGDLHMIELWPQNEDAYLLPQGRMRPSMWNQGIRMANGVPLMVSYMVFNFRNKMLKIPEVRQAFHLALDRQRMLTDLYGVRALLSDGPIPPVFPEAAALKDLPFSYAERDVKRARELLAKAGFPGGEGLPEFIIDAPGVEDPGVREGLDRMLEDLAEAGIRAQLRIEDYPSFARRSATGDLQVAWLQWYADYPDAENFLLLFRSLRPGEDDSFNRGHYESAEYDALYRQMASMYPGPDRTALVRKMVAIVQRDLPWVFLAFPRAVTMVHKSVRGFRYNLLDYSLAEVSLAP